MATQLRKKFVLVHYYNESGFTSIVSFSDDVQFLEDVIKSHPRFGSSHHSFLIFKNDNQLYNVKDLSLIYICNNVAQYLSIGEYAMLKKSYFKASSWFEKAKNSAALGADIIDNY